MLSKEERVFIKIFRVERLEK